MSFDFSTLVTDRTAADVSKLDTLLKKPMSMWTAEELVAFQSVAMKGAYNYIDLNRVTACMDYLAGRLRSAGYAVPYVPVRIPREPAGGGSTSRLPEGYTALAYIESTGTQWVDTGVKATQNTRIVIDFELLAQSALDYIFGARSAGNTRMYELAVQGRKWYSGFGNANNEPSFSGLGRYLVDKNRNVTTINGIPSTATENSFVTAYNLKLFALDNVGSIGFYSKIKLYSCQIHENDTIVRDFIPCIAPNKNIGLYDLVESKFYGNAGTGVFVAGPEVPAPPSPPEPELDPYTWYEEDVPTQSQMAQYLANVAALRAALTLPKATPEVPQDMDGLTVGEANNIEVVLLVIYDYLTALQAVPLRCGAAVCGTNFYFMN